MGSIVRLLSFLLRLSREIRSSRATIVFVSIAGVVSGLASTGMIALVSSLLGPAKVSSRVWPWVFLGLCLALPVFRFLSQLLLFDLTQKSLLTLRLKLSRRILAAPLRQLETLGAGRLLATLTNDIQLIVDSLTAMPVLFMHLAVVVSSLVYLGWLSGPLLLQTLGFIVVGILSYQAALRHAFRFFLRSRERLDEVTQHIRSMVEGTKELKMHQPRRESFLGAFEASTEALQKESRSGQLVFIAGSAWGQTLFFLVVGLLVFVVPHFQAVPKATLIGYIVVLVQMMVPLEVLMTSLPALSRAAVAADKIEKLGFSLESEKAGEVASAALPPSWGRLELAGVTHTYRRENEDEPFLLGPVDLTLRQGELVFLVGGNGSGKTTLAKLLVGLYAPESGEIRIGGRPVTEERLEGYRQLFSVVFADFFVFRELFGIRPEALDAEARGYLEKLHLAKKVQVEEGRLSTIDLSQGQRKRLALLTAYLEDRQIYVFDEWAADQDPLFKEIFYLELLPELKAQGKTVIVISHDDHYFHMADRLVKLDSGQIDAELDSAEISRRFSPVELPWKVLAASPVAFR
ncbi:MAG TPA: cyclic peptide export ABC transporter [Thermoanaerobaculia bacterium]|nr:cyclic peptide export ABC transporter [Thermoanaerobaculia bacterium]